MPTPRLLPLLFLGALLLASGPALPAQAQQAPVLDALSARYVGPSRGGRVTAVAGHRAQPRTFYMGATGGGVWKTTDAGQSWRNVSDGFFASPSIGSIAVAPSDPAVIYVGTGSDGLRSNVIVGRGLYKSTDAGATWTALGFAQAGQLTGLAVHPTDPDVAYVAALGSPFGDGPERGLYKTTDGGATWQRRLFVSDSTGALDVELNPADPDEVYATFWRAERKPWTIVSGAAAEDGIYKSTDGGASWEKLEIGLPQGLIGKIDLSVTPADPDRIYAVVEAAPQEEGLYRSDDRGASWRLVNKDEQLMTRPFYYTNVTADPTDADVVYVNNLRFWKSTDGGATFKRVSTPHGDNHALWINPDDPQVMVQSNDGGANVSLDGGATWSTQHNQPTAELYQLHLDDAFPYRLYAGQQDNTTIAVPSLPPDDRPGGPEAYWEAIGGCETGPAVPRPGDADVVYSNCKGRFGRYNRRTGQEQQYYVGGVYLYGRNPAELPFRFQRVVPIEVSPHDPQVLYHGSQYVHRTTDEGRTWETISPDLTAFRPERQMVSGGPITRDVTGEEHYSTLYVIEESPLEKGVLWTGANDGPVHVSRDGGATWTDVTPPTMPPEGRINAIEPSPHRPGKAYVAGYRFLLDDFRPYLYRTTDYGRTWTPLVDGTNGIPADYPVRVVREDPDREGLLYAGTEFGLFVSFDDGAAWQPLAQGLPVVPITDLRVHRQDLVVATMGRGFWILDDLTPLHQRAEAPPAGAHLFRPRDAYRMRYDSRLGGPADPVYLPAGALLDYHLPTPVQTQAKLEILDAAGAVIRTFTQDAADEPAAGETTDTTQAMRAPTTQRRGAAALPVTAGMHRFRWDLRHEAAALPGGGSTRGPLAMPGTYQVRLTVDGQALEQPLTLHLDPRVAADGVTQADVEAQLVFNLSLRDALAEAYQLAADADTLRTRLEGTDAAEADLRAEAAAVRAALVTPDGMSYPPPMLIDQLHYLAGMTARADQRPGRDAYTRFNQLRAELDALRAQLDALAEAAGPVDE